MSRKRYLPWWRDRGHPRLIANSSVKPRSKGGLLLGNENSWWLKPVIKRCQCECKESFPFWEACIKCRYVESETTTPSFRFLATLSCCILTNNNKLQTTNTYKMATPIQKLVFADDPIWIDDVWLDTVVIVGLTCFILCLMGLSKVRFRRWVNKSFLRLRFIAAVLGSIVSESCCSAYIKH